MASESPVTLGHALSGNRDNALPFLLFPPWFAPPMLGGSCPPLIARVATGRDCSWTGPLLSCQW